MSPSTMELFAANGFKPLDLDGRRVYPMFRTDVEVEDRVRITWLSANPERVQGLTIRLRLPGVPGRRGQGGLLRAGVAESPSIVLWMDTAPPVVDIDCIKVKAGAELQISNRWRLADGREDEWLNNFGMLIDAIDSRSFTLRCNDGYGNDLTFDDLVTKITIERRKPRPDLVKGSGRDD